MNKWQKKHYVINPGLLMSFVLLLLSVSGLCIADTTTKATIIHFSEYEKETGHYPVSMAITSDFLRIDDTKEGKDFVLFDRRKKVIYSVNSEEQQIIQINYKPVTMPLPIELKLREVELKLAVNVPLIAGKQARHYQFYVNDKFCYDLISVPDLMTDAVSALSDFKQVLAGQQAETLRSIPGDLQEGCDLARHTFYPQLYLDKGFPIMEKDGLDEFNYSRSMVNFMEQNISSQRFILPNYQLIPIN